MIKKLSFQILVVTSLMAALSMAPASIKAEDGSTHEAKSDFFMKPSSGLDIIPDSKEREKAPVFSSNYLPLSDTIDIGFRLGKPQKQDITSKKRSSDQRALFGFILHF